MDKAALKRAYKESDRPMGVYKITATQTGTVYIGFDTNVPARLNRHKAELKFGSHRNRELQAAWKAGGEQALEFEVLDLLDPEKDVPDNPAEELRTLAGMWAAKLAEEGHTVVAL